MQISLLNNGVQNQKKNQQTNTPNFGGGFVNTAIEKASPWLQKLDADPIKGVIVLDVLTAIAPNTIIDTFKRNPAQGFETFRRESSGLVINCILPGVAVVGTAWAMKNHIMGDEFKHLPAHEIWANEATINESAATWKSVAGVSKKEDRIKEFVRKRIELIEPEKTSKMLNGGQEAAEKSKNEAIEQLAKIITNPTPEEGKGFFKGIKKSVFGEYKTNVVIDNKNLNDIHKLLAEAFGVSKGVQVKNVGNAQTFSTGMKNYIRDTFALARTFDDKAIGPKNIDKFTEKMQKLLKGKSRVTMVGVGALALTMHYINRRLTEKMTGRKGYSGYKNLDEAAPVHEHKGKLAVQKVLGSAWFGAMAILSMGKPSLSMANFAAPTTTMDQARLLSLTTDVGRVNAACDGNEIKDTLMRDTLIFGHLYVLGDFIQRGVVSKIQKNYKEKHGIDLNLMNHSPEKKNGNILEKFTHWLKGSSVKTIEEIEGTLPQGKMTPDKAKDILALRKKVVSGGAMASLAYSLVALGILAPITIAKITNRNREKQLAAAKKRAVASTPVAASVAPTSIVAVGVAEKVKSPRPSIKPTGARAPKFYTSSQS